MARLLGELPPDSTFASTQRLLHYQLGDRLGEGGFGDVYEAWDSKLCRKVAIKRLKNIASNADLLKEARMAASLRHPAFVKIHALENDDTGQSIVMELIVGQTLRQKLDNQRLGCEKSLEITCQIARAMQDAHGIYLIHGDLKPSNIMCEPNGTVRILDFGLASCMDEDLTMSLLQIDPQGTIAYMAPERLQNAPLQVTSDIYALGVVLYKMIVGTRPFPHLTGLTLAAAHVQLSSDNWDWPVETPLPVIQLIKAMTARLPQQRIATMSMVLEQCEQVMRTGLGSGLPQPIQVSGVAEVKKAGKIPGRALLIIPFLLFFGWTGWRDQALQLEPVALHSEYNAMERGLRALNFYDRPGQLVEAEKLFNSILQYSPDHAAAVAGLSLTYSLRYITDGEDEIWFRKAEAGAQRALQLNDQLALSHIANARVLDQRGKWDEALLALGKAELLDPGNIFSAIEKVDILIHAHRYDEALQLASQNLQRFPQVRFFADGIGNIHYLRGDYSAAEQAFRESLRIEPDVVLAYANLNAVLMAQDKPHAALQILQQGLQVRPSAQLYTNLGNTLFMQGDYAGAAAAFENAVSPVKGNSQDYQGWANLAEILQWIPGREADSRKAYTKARQLLAPRLKRAQDNASLVVKSALFAARVGDNSGVAELVSNALYLAPESAQINLDAGIAYELIGKRQQALDVIHKAIKLGYPESFIAAEPALAELRRDPAFKKP